MIRRGFGFFGMTSARRHVAGEGGGSGIPPLPIVDDTVAMMRDLDKERGRVGRIGGTYCIVLVRLDNLHENEQAPQIVGGVGKRFSTSLRPYDSLYRFGDDMFLIGIAHVKPEDVPLVMERLRSVVASRLLTMDDGSVAPATASFGGTMLDSSLTVEENLDRAGLALYAAAQNGGDSARLWSPDLDAA